MCGLGTRMLGDFGFFDGCCNDGGGQVGEGSSEISSHASSSDHEESDDEDGESSDEEDASPADDAAGRAHPRCTDRWDGPVAAERANAGAESLGCGRVAVDCRVAPPKKRKRLLDRDSEEEDGSMSKSSNGKRSARANSSSARKGWAAPPSVEGRILRDGIRLAARDFESCAAFALDMAFPEDGGLEMPGPCEVSLFDRITQARLKVPCRGHACKHLEAFELESYVAMNKVELNDPLVVETPRCPICNQETPAASLIVDMLMHSLLHAVKGRFVNFVQHPDKSKMRQASSILCYVDPEAEKGKGRVQVLDSDSDSDCVIVDETKSSEGAAASGGQGQPVGTSVNKLSMPVSDFEMPFLKATIAACKAPVSSESGAGGVGRDSASKSDFSSSLDKMYLDDMARRALNTWSTFQLRSRANISQAAVKAIVARRPYLSAGVSGHHSRADHIGESTRDSLAAELQNLLGENAAKRVLFAIRSEAKQELVFRRARQAQQLAQSEEIRRRLARSEGSRAAVVAAAAAADHAYMAAAQRHGLQPPSLPLPGLTGFVDMQQPERLGSSAWHPMRQKAWGASDPLQQQQQSWFHPFQAASTQRLPTEIQSWTGAGQNSAMVGQTDPINRSWNVGPSLQPMGSAGQFSTGFSANSDWQALFREAGKMNTSGGSMGAWGTRASSGPEAAGGDAQIAAAIPLDMSWQEVSMPVTPPFGSKSCSRWSVPGECSASKDSLDHLLTRTEDRADEFRAAGGPYWANAEQEFEGSALRPFPMGQDAGASLFPGGCRMGGKHSGSVGWDNHAGSTAGNRICANAEMEPSSGFAWNDTDFDSRPGELPYQVVAFYILLLLCFCIRVS